MDNLMQKNTLRILVLLLTFNLSLMARGVFNPMSLFEPSDDIETSTTSYLPHLELPLYFGIAYSLVNADNDKDSHFESGYTLTAGYTLIHYMAIEARITQSFSAESTENKLGNNFLNFGLYLKPSILLTHELTLYGLFGYGNSTMDVKGTETIKSHSQWGTGVKYKIDEKVNLFCDYTHYYTGKGFNTPSQNNDVSLGSVNLGVTYTY